MKLLLLALSALASLSFLAVRPAPVPATGEATLADLAWMAGHWASEKDGVRTEEVWLAPAGSLMLAMNRGVAKGGSTSFEFLRIEQRKEGLVYVASPGGKGATEFALADFGERFALFANPAHDFPKGIRYELDAAGALHASVSGDADGKEAAEEWTWQRQ
jgi:uncharacterized protein DUF6265